MPKAENDVLAVVFDSYGGPEVLSLRRIAAPRPGPDEVAVEVHAASMNAVDWKVRSGILQKFFPMTFPAVTGRDGAGQIVAVGPAGDASLIGTRVCFLAPRGVGTWSRKVAVPASLAVPIPATLSYPQAAALPLAGVSAWTGLVQTANITAGMRVLIHAAAGGVGSMAVQIARARSATVIATCSQRNVDFVRDLGAQEVIAYDRTPFEENVRDIDVVLDVMGGDVHRRSYRVLKRGGMMVCLAAAPYEDLSAQYGVKVEMARVREDRTALAAVVDMAAAGKITPRVTSVKLSDFATVHETAQSGHARGKTVVTF